MGAICGNHRVRDADSIMKTHENLNFTSLIKKDVDFKDFAINIHKYNQYLSSNETPNEKLRVGLRILKDIIEEEENQDDSKTNVMDDSKTNLKVAKFFDLVEKRYHTLYEIFDKIKRSYKPIIKLLQIFDLLLMKLNEEDSRKKVTDRVYTFLKEKSMLSFMDWRLLRKLCEQRDDQNLEISSSLRGELVQGFLNRIKKAKRALIWKDETEAVKYAKEMILGISALNEQTLFKCLIMGRFDKKMTGIKIEFSAILGDNGGLFLLINSVPPKSRQEKCILNSGVSENFIEEKRVKDDKVVLGEGSFGKVRLALSVLGDQNMDIGSLVCVKKSLKIGQQKSKQNKTNTLNNIMDSTFEDFMARKLNQSVHAPIPLDMALICCKHVDARHRKGYLIMEVVPENTADKIFQQKKYQKWEYQKPYILAVLKTMEDLLTNERVFNSDLKPQNTLFDPLSRKMTIIDLGSSLIISKNLDLEKFDATDGGFGFTERYCPPEIKKNQLEKLNLHKAISYICGMTIAEITCGIPAKKPDNKKKESWEMRADNTDLDPVSKEIFLTTVKGLTTQNPSGRLSLNKAIEKIEKIGLNADEIMKKATSEQYIEKVRKLVKENPSILSLSEDINETRKKGVIEQLVVENNPKRHKRQRTKELNEELDNFLNNDGADENLLVLLGEAGSGKSLALQLRFIKEVEEWEYGKKAIPLFFNMADEIDLEKVINRINAMAGCNIKLEVPNEEIHLFIDSYDEGHPGEILKSKEEKGKNEEKSEMVMEKYFKKLRNWKKRKIVISCRTDFVQREGYDELRAFKVPNIDEPIKRYIAPIAYGMDEEITSEKNNGIEVQVREWLKREDAKDNAEEIIKKIRRLGVEGRMRTGLMFNMIMKIVVSIGNGENLNNMRLKGFEIYRRTIKEEFREYWRKFVCRQGSASKDSEAILIIKEEIEKRLKIYYEERLKDDDFEKIWEGIERIGELLATEMSLKKSKRVRYSEVEKLIIKEMNGDEFDPDERIEWKTIYQMLRLLGLKLERRKGIIMNEAGENEGEKRTFYENEETIDVGFRHETYKNYYMVRGLKRLLPVVLIMGEKELNEESLVVKEDESGVGIGEIAGASKIAEAFLEDGEVISNYELLRFCGEEILNYKDVSLRDGLRKLLDLEQVKKRRERMQENKTSEVTSSSEAQGKVKKGKTSKAAVIMSLLVAGSYPFQEEDLSELDLAGANMRGGDFFGTKFERTCLREANLRHANVNMALFVEADLRDLQLGVWPDLIGHTQSVKSVCCSPDGKRVASGSGYPENSVKIWDAFSGECVQTLLGHLNNVNSVCFSPDGKRLASGSNDNTVKIWDALSGECVMTLLAHDYGVDSVCFSPDGMSMASGGGDNSVEIWDALSGKCLRTLRGLTNYVGSRSRCSFSPDGKRLASVDGFEGKIWDALSGECVQTLLGHQHIVKSVGFSPDGKRVASDDGHEVKIWNALSGECVQTISPGHYVTSACFSPDGKRVASGASTSRNSVEIWDVLSGDCVQILLGLKGQPNCMCFSPDGKRLVSGSNGKIVKIWDELSGECVQTLSGHTSYLLTLRFSDDGKRVATGGSDNSVKIWDSLSGECLYTLLGNAKGVKSVCFSPDGKRLASGFEDYSVQIWDALSGECIQTLLGNLRKKELLGGVNRVCFSPDGNLVASVCKDKSVNIWDALSGECVQTLLGQTDFLAICFSPDGKRVALGGGHPDSSVNIWDAFSGECLQTLLGHTEWVRSVCFSPDGKTVASGSNDSSVKIWDTLSGECVHTLVWQSNYSVNFLCFSPDGKRLASGNEKTLGNSVVNIWDVLSGELLESSNRSSYEVSQIFNLELNAKLDVILRRIFKPGVEEEFKCHSCVFRNCLIDSNSEKIILQNEGKIEKK